MKKRETPEVEFDEKLLLHFPIPQNNITQVELLREIHKNQVLKEVLEQRCSKINSILSWLDPANLDYELLDEAMILTNQINSIDATIKTIREKILLQ